MHFGFSQTSGSGEFENQCKKLTERQADRQTDAGLKSDQNSLRELSAQP